MGFFLRRAVCPCRRGISIRQPVQRGLADRFDRYAGIYSESDDANQWFDRLKEMAGQMGLAPETKLL